MLTESKTQDLKNKLKKLSIIIEEINPDLALKISSELKARGLESVEIIAPGGARKKLLEQIKKSVLEKQELKYQEPDLIIKVGSESLEDTYILEAAYAEIYFAKVAAQDFDLKDVEIAIDDFLSRKRNFGV